MGWKKTRESIGQARLKGWFCTVVGHDFFDGFRFAPVHTLAAGGGWKKTIEITNFSYGMTGMANQRRIQYGGWLKPVHGLVWEAGFTGFGGSITVGVIWDMMEMILRMGNVLR